MGIWTSILRTPKEFHHGQSVNILMLLIDPHLPPTSLITIIRIIIMIITITTITIIIIIIYHTIICQSDAEV